MNYREYPPGPALTPWVQCCWLLESRGPLPGEAILPDGRMEMIVHFGEPFRRIREGGAPEPQPKSFLADQLRACLRVEPSARAGVLGVRFRPAGAVPFAGFPLHEAAGLALPLDGIWSRPAVARLEQQIAEAPSDAARLAGVEGFLLDRLRPRWKAPPVVDAAVRRILGAGGAGGLADVEPLADWLGLSARQLSKHFRHYVGLGPKTLSRIARFQAVLRLMQEAPRIPWAGAALDCGYYDQAHLIGDFREFAGTSPAARLHPLADCFVDPGSDFSNRRAEPPV